jgi:hypothetical protein
MTEENENPIQSAEGNIEITRRMPNLSEHPTIQDAFQYLRDNFEGTEFEFGKELGRAYAERAPYSEIKRYESALHLKDELNDPDGTLETGFMFGVLEFVEEEMESGGWLGVTQGTTEEQLESFHYDLDPWGIMELGGLVAHESSLEQSSNEQSNTEKKDTPLIPTRFGKHRRLIRLRDGK